MAHSTRKAHPRRRFDSQTHLRRRFDDRKNTGDVESRGVDEQTMVKAHRRHLGFAGVAVRRIAPDAMAGCWRANRMPMLWKACAINLEQIASARHCPLTAKSRRKRVGTGASAANGCTRSKMFLRSYWWPIRAAARRSAPVGHRPTAPPGGRCGCACHRCFDNGAATTPCSVSRLDQQGRITALGPTYHAGADVQRCMRPGGHR